MRPFIVYFVFSFLLGLGFTHDIFAQETVRETATDPFGNQVIVQRHPLTNVASRIWHSNPNFGVFLDSPANLRGNEIDRQMIERFAPRVLNEYKTLLGIDPQQFTLKRAEWDGEFWYLSFDQFYKGIPVHTGKFGFTLNPDGNIISIGSDGHPGLDLSVTPQRNWADLVEIARSRFNAQNPDSLALLSEPALLIYPDWLEEEVKYHLAYKIELHDQIGGDNRRYFIDANTGHVLLDRSMWRQGDWTVSGNVKGRYWPVNSGGSAEEATPEYLAAVKVYNTLGQEISSDLLDGNGDYSMSGNHAYQTFYVDVMLKGNWARIKNPSNQVRATQSFVTSGNHVRDFNFSDTEDGFHVYYHMNIIHDFIKGSPFSYNGMDWQMEARVDDDDVPNAEADGTKLRFGNNNRNWWESSDVVYHEYTHNIVYKVYGNNFIGDALGEMGRAMDEGIADYFAATINEEPTIDWVGRTVSNALTMDNYDDQGDNPWFRGQILSGAMWDLESTTSQTTARKLNFKAMQITPQPDTYQEFVDNVILADDNNADLCDQTPNTSAILTAFESNHGISPTNLPDPLAVTISGPAALGYKETGTWTANPSGGYGSYSYEWRWRYNGTGSWSGVAGTSQSYSRLMLDTDFELKVTVTSSGCPNNVEDTQYVYYDGLVKPTTDVTEQTPQKFSLSQNHPNPFNPSTEIQYGLPEAGRVTLSIYNLVGQKVRTLVDETQGAGFYSLSWDGRDEFSVEVASGIYLYRLQIIPTQLGTEPFVAVRKLTLLR